MSDIVLSVEYIETTISNGATSGSVALTKGQTTSNCVPFVSYKCNNDNLDNSFCDVYFDSDNIYFSRGGSSADVVIGTFVVEFDPGEVKVQAGELTASGIATNHYTAESFDPSSTGMVFHTTTSGSSQTTSWCDFSVRGRVVASGTLDFYKNAAGLGSTSGHYYTFEALNDAFSVEHVDHSLTEATLTQGFVPSQFNDQTKLLVLSSYATNVGAEVGQGTVRTYHFYSGAQVACDRHAGAAGNVVDVNTQLIGFNSPRLHNPTFRGVPSVSTTSYTENQDVAVDLNSAIYVSSNIQGIIRVNTTGSAANDCGRMLTKFIDSSTAYAENYSTTGSYPVLYVIDWNGLVCDTGTNESPLDPSVTPVKSIERLECSFSSAYYSRYVSLTKGQNTDNCVIFKSQKASGNSTAVGQVLTMCDAYFSGGYLHVTRTTTQSPYPTVYITVVEFYPDQVKCTHGTVANLTAAANSVDVTIDAVTLNKTFMMFYHTIDYSSYHWSYINMVGGFLNNTTLHFYKYGASRFVAHYTLVEDLGNYFEVEHVDVLSGTSVSTDPIAYPAGPCVTGAVATLGSFATSAASYSNLTGGLRINARGAAWIEFSNSSSTDNTIKAYVFCLHFLDNKSHVYAYTHSISTPPSTGAIADTIYEGDASYTTFVSCIMGAGAHRHNYSTTAYLTDPFVACYFDPETMNYTVTCRSGSTSYITYSSVVAIDWRGKDILPDYPAINTCGSFVKSVETAYIESTGSAQTYSLTKRQIVENCLPLVTFSKNLGSYEYQRLYPLVTFTKPMIVRVDTLWAATNTRVNIQVIEFDPNQVRVQSGVTLLTATNTYVEIDEVDLTKAFVVIYMASAETSSSKYASYTYVRATFSDSTHLWLKRYSAAEPLMVAWYVVECLQDQWIVSSVSYTMASSSVYWGGPFGTVPHPSIDRSMYFINYTYNGDSYYPRYIGLEAQTDGQRIICFRDTGSSSVDIATYIVNFNDRYFDHGNMSVYTTYGYIAVGSSSYNRTIKPVDIERSIITIPNMSSIGRTDGNADTGSNTLFSVATFVDSSTINVHHYDTRYYYASSYQVVELPFYTHVVSGTVTEEGVPVSTTVNIHQTSDGRLLGSTVSASGTGEFSVYVACSGTVYAVCFDPNPLSAPYYNALIYSDITPTVVSGSFAYNEGWVS